MVVFPIIIHNNLIMDSKLLSIQFHSFKVGTVVLVKAHQMVDYVSHSNNNSSFSKLKFLNNNSLASSNISSTKLN